eukprot:scaffold4102_cov174-Ochromonas_danica.AAC.9
MTNGFEVKLLCCHGDFSFREEEQPHSRTAADQEFHRQMMMTVLLFLALLVLFQISHAFTYSGMQAQQHGRGRGMALRMGGNTAKFGIFSPVVYGAKFILGEAKLNKVSLPPCYFSSCHSSSFIFHLISTQLRGKAISLHSQAITEWCLQYGAYNLRLKLIKKAKKNGDTLGFLV